jgi:aspartate/methionine/tyrosine aminotransferase
VATVPGDGFGTSGRGHIRISYAASEDDLREGMDRIRRVVADVVTTAAGHGIHG